MITIDFILLLFSFANLDPGLQAFASAMLKSIYQSLAGACSMVDCCFGLRPCHQAVFPCIRSCSYGDRKVFYNYDGTETVEPLVDYFKPTNGQVKRNMIRGECVEPPQRDRRCCASMTD